MKPIYIFGHKNPDADSVCSAIALAYLKEAQGLHCIPKVIGPINRGTEWALNYFNVAAPSYINDVRIQIKDVKYTKRAFINENESINDAFNFMRDHDLTAVPLVDDNNILTGYITLKELAKHLIGDPRDIIDTNIKHLIKTLDAKIITNFEHDFKGQIQTVPVSSETFIRESKLKPDDIVVVGDRYRILEYAINNKVKLIILSGNKFLPKDLVSKAQKNKVSVITSPYSSFELCNKLSLANFIKTINKNPNPTTIEINSYYSDFLTLSRKLNHTNYPVVKKNNECVGVLRITDQYDYEKKKVILVDHNNYEQSVEGLDEAEIIEVFDHHNIGNIGTTTPIYFTCRPVGCTATIIFDRFEKEKVECPREIAGLLLSAVISDTLLFTSPTTTPIDIEYAKKMAKIAKVDVNKYGLELLKASSSIKGLSVAELINQDFKSYRIENKQYGICQITTMDFDEIEKNIPEIVNKLNEMSAKDYEGVLIFITDIIKQGSYVLYNDDSKWIVESAFDIKDLKEGLFIPGLISRKKQMLPAIMKLLEK